jgi:DNA anti-recombination protein RmuC
MTGGVVKGLEKAIEVIKSFHLPNNAIHSTARTHRMERVISKIANQSGDMVKHVHKDRIEAIRRVVQDAETKYEAYSARLSTEVKNTNRVIKKLRQGCCYSRQSR